MVTIAWEEPVFEAARFLLEGFTTGLTLDFHHTPPLVVITDPGQVGCGASVTIAWEPV